jgi:SPP1 gp7 family putative phage head morphogenesis protein
MSFRRSAATEKSFPLSFASGEPDLSYALNLPPEKASAYFKSKGLTKSQAWQDTWQEAHTKAFTVAHCAKIDILQDIRSSVAEAIDKGATLEQFKKDLMPTLKAKGWWGKVQDPDAPTHQIQLGSPHRLQTIYRTNLQTAYMAGRYKEMIDNVDDRPYWQYVAVMDSKTRPAHAALNGKVLRYDDPFWDSFYPPNGWGCRCRVRALDDYNIKERGLKVENSEGMITQKETYIIRRQGEVGQPATYFKTTYKNPAMGSGISPDAGWDYNPGKYAYAPFTPEPYDPAIHKGSYKTIGWPVEDKIPLEQLPAKPLDKTKLLPEHKESDDQKHYINMFLNEFGTKMGKPIVYKDVLNEPLVISEDLFFDRTEKKYKVFKNKREQFLKFYADTIKDPTEIWLTWVEKDGKTRLSKRYLSIYKDERGKIAGISIFDWLDDIWQGTTTFQNRDFKYIDKQRSGTLLYLKK